jgi:acetyl-CoA carboxylase biotin carboxyl carrier protein
VALSDEDVREILRIVDGAELDELRIETEGLSLHLVRGDRAPAAKPVPEGSQPEPAAAEGADAPEGADGFTIEAPMLGVFYRSPSPGASPFVDVGTRVESDTIVCIIEVMKMMNSVPAGFSGTIAGIHAENAALVEYGQPLFSVAPA